MSEQPDNLGTLSYHREELGVRAGPMVAGAILLATATLASTGLRLASQYMPLAMRLRSEAPLVAMALMVSILGTAGVILLCRGLIKRPGERRLLLTVLVGLTLVLMLAQMLLFGANVARIFYTDWHYALLFGCYAVMTLLQGALYGGLGMVVSEFGRRTDRRGMRAVGAICSTTYFAASFAVAALYLGSAAIVAQHGLTAVSNSSLMNRAFDGAFILRLMASLVMWVVVAAVGIRISARTPNPA